MKEVIQSTGGMIGGMTPTLLEGAFVFATFPDFAPPADVMAHAIGSFREAEGLSLILPVETARAHGLADASPMACITLNVYSSLDGVGLTAAVAKALADKDIACNMVSAFHHDHAFVPADAAVRAVDILNELQSTARADE